MRASKESGFTFWGLPCRITKTIWNRWYE